MDWQQEGKGSDWQQEGKGSDWQQEGKGLDWQKAMGMWPLCAVGLWAL